MKSSNKRNCYCDLWEKSPETLKDQGVEPGYCGICSICKSQGHLRHAPGCHPYTDAWCDKCFRVQAIINNLQCAALPMLITSIVFKKWYLVFIAISIFALTTYTVQKGQKIVKFLAGT